jgi:hypothetical protein
VWGGERISVGVAETKTTPNDKPHHQPAHTNTSTTHTTHTTNHSPFSLHLPVFEILWQHNFTKTFYVCDAHSFAIARPMNQ